jgi:dienelactone hydrolase
MALMRRVATLGAAVAAVRRYARQNPEKVNRYADQAASWVDRRTHGRYRRQIDAAVRQVRKETSVPGSNPSTARSYPSQREDRRP